MNTKHLLTALLVFPCSLWAAGSKPVPKATSALQFQQLSDTRMSMGDNIISFVTGDVERMTIDASGNVGIGSASPDEKLHIKGNLLLDAFDRGSENGVFFRENFNNSNKYNLSILSYDDGDGSADALGINAYDGIYFNTGSNTRNTQMVVNANGNVGIGTDSPTNKLEVHGSAFNRISAIVDSNFQNGFQIKRTGGSYPTDWEIYNPISSTDLRFYNAGDRLTIKSNGNVGIGTTSPSSKLHILGTPWTGIKIQDVTTSNGRGVQNYYLDGNDDGWSMYYSGHSSGQPLIFVPISGGSQGAATFSLLDNGNVGIGTTSPSHKLHVAGNIHGSTYSADSPPSWPDYVFEDTYQLSEIAEVEKYIEENHHLPEIPSAAEVKENGVDIVSMQAKLLQKIEELTLYVIEQNKRIEEQHREISNLKTQITK